MSRMKSSRHVRAARAVILLFVFRASAGAQATSIATPDGAFLIQTADRLARSSPLGSLALREMGPTDIEIRVWTGFGATGIEGMAMRRAAAGWSAWYMAVIPCSLRLEKWIADTAGPATMAQFRKMAGQACGLSIARPGYNATVINFDSLLTIPLPQLNADSVWTAVLATGVRDLPLDNGVAAPLQRETTAHVVELREGNRYRASEIRSEPDSPTRRNAAAIVDIALAAAKAVRPAMDPRPTGQPGAYAPAVGDSTAARFLMQSVFQSTAFHAARGALARDLRPWFISMPTSPLPEWSRYREHFLRTVGGRPLVPTDTVRSSLYVSTFEMHGDTLIAQYSVGYAWKCGGEWWGDATHYEMRAIRHQTAWELPQTRIRGFADGISCLRRPH